MGFCSEEGVTGLNSVVLAAAATECEEQSGCGLASLAPNPVRRSSSVFRDSRFMAYEQAAHRA